MSVNTNNSKESKPIYLNQKINSPNNEINGTLNNVNSGVSTPLVAYDKNGKIVPFNHGTTEDINVSNITDNDTSDYRSLDKRVSLTVRPRYFDNNSENSLEKRVKDILSGGIDNGLLFEYCKESFGIIFPYTPQISGLGKTVTYESVDIPHSNLKFNQYKNTSSNDISLKAKFTADTLNNGLHMLSAIWFLNACSMSKFGKSEGNDAGLPPPILYLSGYNKMIDNIPVVISKFDYNLDDKLYYVKLDVPNKENLTYWVPTELDITINLKVQPNLRKVYNQWSLDKYKTGELFLNNMESRNPGGEYIPSGWTW